MPVTNLLGVCQPQRWLSCTLAPEPLKPPSLSVLQGTHSMQPCTVFPTAMYKCPSAMSIDMHTNSGSIKDINSRPDSTCTQCAHATCSVEDFYCRNSSSTVGDISCQVCAHHCKGNGGKVSDFVMVAAESGWERALFSLRTETEKHGIALCRYCWLSTADGTCKVQTRTVSGCHCS